MRGVVALAGRPPDFILGISSRPGTLPIPQVVEPVTYRAQVPLTALDGSNYRARIANAGLLPYTTSTTSRPAPPPPPAQPVRYSAPKTPPPPTNHVDEYPKDDPEVGPGPGRAGPARPWRGSVVAR